MTRRRRAPIENKVNHDRWLVSYADFITLLFAFFVVMYSVSQVNENAYRELSETLGAAFKSRPGQSEMVPSPSEEAPLNTADSQLVSTQELAQRVNAALSELIEAGQVSVQATDDWVEVSVNANLLFESGSATPSAEAESIFARISALLAPYTNAIEVSGHTDDRPINNQQFNNNWELSAARATSVVRLLSEQGIAPERLAATGYGEFHPVADNTTEAGRAKNRRVVLHVARHQAERPTVEAAAMPAVLNNAEPIPAPNPAADTPILPEPEDHGAIEGAGTDSERPAVKPIVREDGSLLFTSDPERDGSGEQEAGSGK